MVKTYYFPGILVRSLGFSKMPYIGCQDANRSRTEDLRQMSTDSRNVLGIGKIVGFHVTKCLYYDSFFKNNYAQYLKQKRSATMSAVMALVDLCQEIADK